MPLSADVADLKGVGLRCVNCGWRIGRLFVQYSPGNIRLIKCDNCQAVADPYIECEFMIIFIDLILHKTKAYRHLLFNMLNSENSDVKGIVLKSALMFFILDACIVSLSVRSKDGWDSSRSTSEFTWTCLKVSVDILFGNFVFIAVLCFGIRFLLKLNYDIARYKEISLATLVSSYFKMFSLAMMVWNFPPSVLFIIDIFVLSSNTVAFRVLTQLRGSACIALFSGAHAAKFFTSWWLRSLM